MMIVKDRGIVLRTRPFSETSRVVSWLTHRHGRIATLVKGSQRPKSAFLGQYDLFYTCEMLFYARHRRDLHVLKECSPLNSRPGLRGNYRATAAASYFAELVGRVCPAEAPHPDAFQLLDTMLDFLAQGRGIEAVFLVFEIKLLAGLGLSPHLDGCLRCRKPVAASAQADAAPADLAFSHARGGLLCEHCRASAPASETTPLARDVLGLLRFWQKTSVAGAVANARCTPAQWSRAYALLEQFIQHHLEIKPLGRPIALELLRWPAPRNAATPPLLPEPSVRSLPAAPSPPPPPSAPPPSRWG